MWDAVVRNTKIISHMFRMQWQVPLENKRWQIIRKNHKYTSKTCTVKAHIRSKIYRLKKNQFGTIMQKGTYMSFADIFVNPIASACCLPSAIIAWQNRFQQKR
jgi:trehalose/maltose hydrolase-like predicted phosphorylase